MGSFLGFLATEPQLQMLRLDEGPPDLEGFEALDKWKRCEREGVGECLVYKHNRTRAANEGFPSRLEVGKAEGLTDHEVASVLGWTTGDFRFVNPIARGQDEVEFEEYFGTEDASGSKTAKCRLTQQEVLPYVQVLNHTLLKMPAVAGSQRLWRGHRRPIPAEVGTVIMLRGFTSVSVNPDEAVGFVARANLGKSPKRSILAFQQHRSGRGISKLSARRQEAEVLFPLNSCFEVVAGDADTSAADDKVVKEAEEELRQGLPEAEIRIVYLKEVDSSTINLAEVSLL
eukprot:TRINITY_DN16274_c0_g2_i1.p1 TRINITY_DN16274_c0_g2~~TRINITY_DN16274_c0_g2_i1.p1  ORF type:complete len:286 (-),score=64.61 TRINITY_DN16274_c0_g2_i1:295-1152(-)